MPKQRVVKGAFAEMTGKIGITYKLEEEGVSRTGTLAISKEGRMFEVDSPQLSYVRLP